MKNHASGHRRSGPGYRTSSTFRAGAARAAMSKIAGKALRASLPKSSAIRRKPTAGGNKP